MNNKILIKNMSKDDIGILAHSLFFSIRRRVFLCLNFNKRRKEAEPVCFAVCFCILFFMLTMAFFWISVMLGIYTIIITMSSWPLNAKIWKHIAGFGPRCHDYVKVFYYENRTNLYSCLSLMKIKHYRLYHGNDLEMILSRSNSDNKTL